MTKSFELNKGYNYTYIGLAVSIGVKVELRYYILNNDFSMSEVKKCCIATLAIEKMCRKWCDEMNFILWKY